MTSTIKAIETVYNGYRFRSRLEARWAVFFDTLSIRYEYEKEGYDLGDGLWYLPDFWLPDYELFVEVKPDFYISDIEGLKARELVVQTGNKLLMVFNCDYNEKFLLYSYRETDTGDVDHYEEQWQTELVNLMACTVCNALGYFSHDFNYVGQLRQHCDKQDGVDGRSWKLMDLAADNESWHAGPHQKLIAAFRAARQARFEHGETPKVRQKRDLNGKCRHEFTDGEYCLWPDCILDNTGKYQYCMDHVPEELKTERHKTLDKLGK
jgi:hypothetical protein